MTSLRENIKKSLDDNLKKRDNIATATLRLILAAVKDSDIENRSKNFRTFDIYFVCTYYSNMGKSKGNNLFKIRGVSKNFLVTSNRCIETNFTKEISVITETLSKKMMTIIQY